MIKEGTQTQNGYIWRNGAWRRVKGRKGRIPSPPGHQFGQGTDEGMVQDIAPLIQGRVEIDVHEVQEDGSTKLVEQYTDDVVIEGFPYDPKNTIVAKAPNIMANALAGITNPDFVIGGVQWGTGGHVVGDPSTPIPPTAGDLTLETFVLETSIASSSIGDTFVQFESALSTSQGNGNVFTEAGLVITGVAKLMFARKTFPGITKTSNRTITLRWIISFLQNAQGSDCQGVGLFGQLGPIRQFRFVVPSSPSSFTDITVPLAWTPGLNRLWVWRNGKRVFDGETYVEQHPTGIINIDPPLVVGETWTFEVIE